MKLIAQQTNSGDSLQVFLLSEVTIQASSEADTLQNFVRANKSATTEDILSRLQGMYLIRRGSYGQEPMIHGMSSGQLNVTIDGMKMFGACTDKMDPVTIYIEPQNLSAINVMQGSVGSKMGSTVGGSIDMQLAQPRFSSKRFSGQAGVGYQGVSRGLNTYANGNYATGKSAYNFSVNYRHAQNYKSGDGNDVNYTQYEKVNLSGGAKWSIGQDTLYANVLIDDGWNIGFAALPMDVGFAKARIYALTYQRVRCHGLVASFQVKAYHNSIFHEMDDTNRPDVAMHMDMPGESKTSGLFVEGKSRRMGRHLLSFRGDFYNNNVLAEMTMYPDGEAPMYMQTWPSSSRSDAGLYVEDTYSVASLTKIKMSARADVAYTLLHEGTGKDQWEVFGLEESSSTLVTMSFNVNFQQRIGHSLLAELHAGYGERTPTLSETFGFYLFNQSDGYDYIGNPKLGAEKSWAGDMTLSWFTNSLQLNVMGYYKYLPDYIYASTDEALIPMTPGANGVKVFNNIPSAVFYGTDFNILANLTPKLQLMNVIKVTYAKDNNSAPLPLIPPMTTITTLQYRVKQWSFQGECEAALKQNRFNESFGEDETPAYAIANVRVQYTFEKKNISVNGGVENLFNKLYHAHLDWANIPRPGRNVYAALTYRF
jgi:iron complex outermembrane receptor protein